jgi:hypothetical protein
MTKEEFIEKIQQYRQEAEKLMEGNGGYKIKRGMAHVISGYVEDIFALFLASNIGNKDLEFFVDKVTSIRFEKNEKAKSFKPDVSIINNNTLTHYFDLKTNMGWNREFITYLEEKNQFIESLRGKKAWIRHSKDLIQEIKIKENVIYQMVVVFGWNINQRQLRDNLEIAKKYPNIKVHILYMKKENGEYGISEEAFNEIERTIKQ